MYKKDRRAMYQDKVILCASSAYDKKYFFNEDFKGLPKEVKEELKVVSVLHTEDVGGILIIEFDEQGQLLLGISSDEGDLLFDDIGAALKIKKLQKEKQDLFESIEMYYKVFFLGEDIGEE